MAQPAAVLQIMVEANTGKATSSLSKFDSTLSHSSATAKKATRTHDAFGKSTSKLGSLLSNAAKGAAATAIAYVSISEAKAAITTTEDLAKATLLVHRNLGLSITTASEWISLSQAWGVDSKKLGMSFKTLAGQVSSAESGSSAAQTSFKTLGISMKELRKLSPEDLLLHVSQSMHNTKGSTDKLTAAGKLFGRGWQSLNPIIGAGSKALKEQLHWAKEYGATLDGHSIKSLEQLKEAQVKANLAMEGMQIAFTEKVAPSLLKVGLAFAGFINQMRTGTGAGGKLVSVMKSVGKVLGFLWGVLSTTVQGIKIVVGVVRALFHAFNSLPGPIKTLAKVMFWMISTPFTATFQALKFGRKAVGLFGDAFQAVAGTVKGAFNKVSNVVTGGTSTVIGAFKKMGHGIAKVATGIANVIGTVATVIRTVVGFIVKAVNKAVGALGDLKDKIPSISLPSISLPSPGDIFGQKGLMVPGQGTGDKVPAMLEPGEVVINRKAVAAMGGPQRVNQVNRRIPRFAKGGFLKKEPQVQGGGVLGGMAQAGIHDVFTAAKSYVKKHRPMTSGLGSIGSTLVGGGALSPGQFIRIARAALAMTGHKGVRGGALSLESLAMQESSLNPNAWNKTDINAQQGNPSKGLMQVTESNFRAFHEPGTSHNIFDPLANIAASINYQYKTYGGLVTHSPYRKGGIIGDPPGGPAQHHSAAGPMMRGSFSPGHWAGSPRTLERLYSIANYVNRKHYPYSWGGGHEQPANLEPFDCSGAVSYLLQQAGYPISTNVASGFEGAFQSGPGNPFSIHASGSHVFTTFGSKGWGTHGSSGAGWFSNPASSGFTVRHPVLAAAGKTGGKAAAKAPPKKPKHLSGKSQKKLAKLATKLKGFGLYPKIQSAIDSATALASQFEEYAGYAEQLAGDTGEGSWKGVPESRYLLQELQQLFIVRNKLVSAFELLSANRDKLAVMMARWQKELKALKTVQHPSQAQKQRKAVLNSSIKAGLASQTDLNNKIGAVTGTDGLVAVQGSGGPMGKMASLTPTQGLGFGGSIFDVSKRILDLGVNTSVSGTGTDDTSALLRQLLQESNQRFLVSQAQYGVFKNMPPYAGAFAMGGVVPGPVGAPRTAIVHGGETVTPNGAMVEVHFYEGERRTAVKVNGEFVDARIERHQRRAGRKAARALPGSRSIGP